MEGAGIDGKEHSGEVAMDWCELLHSVNDIHSSISIGLQIANTKKVQQALSAPGVVERLLPHKEGESEKDFEQRCANICSTFARMWSLSADNKGALNDFQELFNKTHLYHRLFAYSSGRHRALRQVRDEASTRRWRQ